MFFLFSRKERTKEKPIGCSTANHLSSDVFRELYTGSYIASLRCLARPEPAALALSLFAAHASYNLYSFRDSANDLFRYSKFAPAPCSPPLGGSSADSAVRFTPAESRAGAKTSRPDVQLDV